MSLNKKSKRLSYSVTKLKKEKKEKRIDKNSFVIALTKEISGRAPYELRAMEMLRRDEEKRCKKFMKKRLGSLKMAKKKIEILGNELRG